MKFVFLKLLFVFLKNFFQKAEYITDWYYFQPITQNSYLRQGKNVIAFALNNPSGSSDAFLDCETRLATEMLDLQDGAWWTYFNVNARQVNNNFIFHSYCLLFLNAYI